MKDYRNQEMKNLSLMLCFLFLIWCTPALSFSMATEEQSRYEAISFLLESVLISAVLSSATLLWDCLIGSKLKDKLVGLGFIPRPGETIFTRIKENKLSDDRFQLYDAASLYSDIICNLPNNKKDRQKFENKMWYKIYLKYQEKGQVQQTQRDYLMCRDLYIETLGFAFFYLISPVVFSSVVVFSNKFLMVLFVLAVVLNICTHLKMNRFANTVLAVDIGNHKESEN